MQGPWELIGGLTSQDKVPGDAGRGGVVFDGDSRPPHQGGCRIQSESSKKPIAPTRNCIRLDMLCVAKSDTSLVRGKDEET
jgi:hypothetical protein